MSKSIILLYMLLTAQFCGLGPKIGLPDAIPGQEAPLHGAWDTLLGKHVDDEGWVDYQAFAEDRAALEAYLDYLASHIPGDHWSKEEKLAYYINLYNAGTILLILDYYPLESIKDIWNPWGKDRLKIGPSTYSLNDIEHRILRKMGEPRIHFAVNCASYSCPKLLREAFTAAKMEEQLEAAARDFINDPRRNRIAKGQVELSRIFKWYRGDFEDGERDLLDYINGYLERPLPGDTDIEYLPYDWNLNDRS